MIYKCLLCKTELKLMTTGDTSGIVIRTNTFGWCPNPKCHHYGILTIKGEEHDNNSKR